ncbi:hypothetical protein [Flavihumibacter petaseus]|uniref:Uncharacterized protein n=1 Tax=Flavihumibacter petaseus NBRC 106054 TaxID=1220578 RepID=A0A0E9N2P2_9BACT|nr:hypothetical protein [Flavihumibacter petaseus]GAO44114.1 hypothetical protein FPE01S_03_01530 [Flavihumibacter petaseus NBRC 106054]
MNAQQQPFDEGDYAQAKRIAYLITGYIRSTLSDQERDELDAWVTASDQNIRLFADLTDKQNASKEFQAFDSINSEAVRQKILVKLIAAL